jgi:NADPH:quinone reductase-like Zn-dependent oxidoreductase
VTVRPVQAHATPAILSGLAEAAAAGRLRTHIQRRYRLDEAPAALHDFARQGTLGKLVVDGI